MRENPYLDFDLVIEPAGAGRYRATVQDSPIGGEPTSEFGAPFTDDELERFLVGIGRPRQDVPPTPLLASEPDAVQAFGSRLFDAIFVDKVLASFQRSSDLAGVRHRGLRIRLNLTKVPDLADLPWEYLFDTASKQFLVRSRRSPLVRHLSVTAPIEPLSIEPPLRVLVMISSPEGFPKIDRQVELESLREALGDLTERGLVHIQPVETPTFGGLQEAISGGPFHVFHFIGHGGFSQTDQDGVLFFEDPKRKTRRVKGDDLGQLLREIDQLRLVILNACEGGRASVRDPFAGVAQGIFQQAIPAVIAMQFKITQEAARTLSSQFYRAICRGEPVEAALAEARWAIYGGPTELEWGIPVLYMRSPDGQLFDIEGLPAEEGEGGGWAPTGEEPAESNVVALPGAALPGAARLRLQPMAASTNAASRFGGQRRGASAERARDSRTRQVPVAHVEERLLDALHDHQEAFERLVAAHLRLRDLVALCEQTRRELGDRRRSKDGPGAVAAAEEFLINVSSKFVNLASWPEALQEPLADLVTALDRAMTLLKDPEGPRYSDDEKLVAKAAASFDGLAQDIQTSVKKADQTCQMRSQDELREVGRSVSDVIGKLRPDAEIHEFPSRGVREDTGASFGDAAGQTARGDSEANPTGIAGLGSRRER